MSPTSKRTLALLVGAAGLAATVATSPPQWTLGDTESLGPVTLDGDTAVLLEAEWSGVEELFTNSCDEVYVGLRFQGDSTGETGSIFLVIPAEGEVGPWGEDEVLSEHDVPRVSQDVEFLAWQDVGGDESSVSWLLYVSPGVELQGELFAEWQAYCWEEPASEAALDLDLDVEIVDAAATPPGADTGAGTGADTGA